MKIRNYTIGADIETFLQSPEKEIISAEGFIKGSKEEPYQFDKSDKYYCTSLDNVLMEFCIPPARKKSEFLNGIRKSLGYINKQLPKGYCSAAIPAANLNPRWLQTEQAQRFGCEPDFNAYTLGVNPPPNADDPTLRSAGFHIHLGYQDPDVDVNVEFIRAMDLFLGIPSVIMEPENKRKLLYGKAGAFRNKPYGVEYRTLSNYLLANSRLLGWAYQQTENAIAYVNNGNKIEGGLCRAIVNAINKNDKALAAELIKDFNLKLAA